MANIRFTKKLLKAGMSSAGAWNKQQLAILATITPMTKGWQARLMGKYISQENALLFVSLKNSHLNAQQIEVAKKKEKPRFKVKAAAKPQQAKSNYTYRASTSSYFRALKNSR